LPVAWTDNQVLGCPLAKRRNYRPLRYRKFALARRLLPLDPGPSGLTALKPKESPDIPFG
jgi:hypothetical protein